MSESSTTAAGSNVSTETILFYTHELTRSKRKIDEATAAHRLLVKRAKGDGVPTAAVLESVAWSRLEPEERLARLIDRIRVESARYPENGREITDLLANMDVRVSEKMRYTDTLFDAEQKGYQAGKYAAPVEDCPYPAGSELAATWRKYWHEGQAANALDLGDNARAASTKRDKPPTAKQRGMVLPLEPARKRRGRPPANGEDASAPS
jgi:ribosome modulation factor